MNNQYKHAVHTWMFGNLPLDEIATCLSSIGFCADLSLRDSGQSSPEKVIESYQTSDVFSKVTIPVCTAMFMENTLNLSDKDSAIRDHAICFAKRCVEASACVGADRLLISPSVITTAHRYSSSRESDWRTAVESLQKIGEFAQKYRISLMIEPINRYRVSLVHTVAEAVRMAEETCLENIGVVPDVFHMCMEETAGVSEAIRSAGSRLLCLHIGSNTRMIPGGDAFDWVPIFQTLHEKNYRGILSYEPARLYFDEFKIERDLDCRNAFLKKLQQGKTYLNTVAARVTRKMTGD